MIMERILEKNEIQLAGMQAIDNTNVTFKYFSAAQKRRIAAVASILTMAATKTAKLELVQATDADGTGVTAVTGAEKTITANAEVIEATVTLATFLVDGTITITTHKDGVNTAYVFTAHTDTTTVADREFSIAGNDTADAAQLVICINDATYGVVGVTASSAAGVVTIVAHDGYTLTVASDPNDGTCTKATVEAIIAVDIDAESLDSDNDFDYVAAKVTTTATTTAVAVQMILTDQYYDKVSQPTPHTIL
jgi:hypothetical protein